MIIDKELDLERIYIFKHTKENERILGVNVQSEIEIRYDDNLDK